MVVRRAREISMSLTFSRERSVDNDRARLYALGALIVPVKGQRGIALHSDDSGGNVPSSHQRIIEFS